MAGVNVKMGVSGVSQFKSSMKDAQASVKNLNEQLKLNETQLKLTGDQELYLQNKTALLQEAIKKQAEVVRQSEAALQSMQRNGVDQSSAAFQRMQQNMYKASNDLMQFQAELQGVGQAGEDAGDGVDSMNAQLQRIGDGISFQNVKSGLDGIAGKLEAAAKKALDLGRRLIGLTLDAGSWADDLVTEAKVYGLTPGDLQRMQKTSRLIDTSVETIVGAKQKMSRGLGSGNAEVMGAFAEFGLDPSTMATTEDKFWAIGDAIMHMSDAEEQEVYAQRVFGRSWHELIPLFEAGREEYERMNESWNVVSDEDIDRLGKMDDAFQSLQNEWETFKMTMLASLSEALTPALETLSGLLEKLNEFLKTDEGQKMMEDLRTAISGLFSDLANVDPQQVIQGFTDVFTKVIDGFNWLVDHKDAIIHAFEAIVIAWGAVKIGSGITTMLQLLQGLGLVGTKGPTAPPTTTLPPTTTTPPVVTPTGPAVTPTGTPVAPVGTGVAVTNALGGGFTFLEGVGLAAEGIAIAAFIDGLVRDQMLVNQWMENGQRVMADFEAKSQLFQGDQMYSGWAALRNFTSITGGTSLEDTEAARAFAEEFMTWWNDDTVNPMLEELAELMTDEEFSGFQQAMEDILSGTPHYSEEEISTFYGSINRAVELMEQQMTENANKNEVTPDDLALLQGLPEAVAGAVERANITVYIDGDIAGSSLAPRIGKIMGRDIIHAIR